MLVRLAMIFSLLLTSAGVVIARNLEAGIAFTEPALMRELDEHGFSLGAILSQTTGVGIACLKRLFDRRYLYANFARFELVGVINC